MDAKTGPGYDFWERFLVTLVVITVDAKTGPGYDFWERFLVTLVFVGVGTGIGALIGTLVPEGSGADRIVGAIRPGVHCGDSDYAAMP